MKKARKMSQKLSDTILKFQGDDARAVLQGQTTRNFAETATGSVLEGAFCDLKGRVIADFCAVIPRDDLILMRTDSEVAANLKNHLQKFLMFSKTELTITTLSVWPCKDDAAIGLNQVGDEAIRIDRQGGFYEVWSDEEPAPEELVDVARYRINRLMHGEARLVSSTIGKYLPQDLNYDLNGRIDFDKGCYTGQEIIARLHYRGEPKRRLRLLTVPSESQIAPGEKVVNAEGKTLGSVIEASVGDASWLCLCQVVLDVDVQSPHIGGQLASVNELAGF